MKTHVKRDDVVEVIAGNDSGKRGKVLRVDVKANRVFIEGVNLRWKNLRKSQKNPQGGRTQQEMSIHASNVKVMERPKAASAKKTSKKKQK